MKKPISLGSSEIFLDSDSNCKTNSILSFCSARKSFPSSSGKYNIKDTDKTTWFCTVKAQWENFSSSDQISFNTQETLIKKRNEPQAKAD